MRKAGSIDGIVRSNIWKAAAAIAALLAVSLLFGIPVKMVVAVSVFIVAASFSTFYFNYVSVPVNFELVKLFTVVTAATYGLWPGILVGVSSTLFGKVLIGRIDEKLPLSIAAIALVALAASLFSGGSIASLGIILVLSYNVAMFALSMLMGGDLAWNLPYEGSNFLINLFLFAKVAPLLQGAVA